MSLGQRCFTYAFACRIIQPSLGSSWYTTSPNVGWSKWRARSCWSSSTSGYSCDHSRRKEEMTFRASRVSTRRRPWPVFEELREAACLRSEVNLGDVLRDRSRPQSEEGWMLRTNVVILSHGCETLSSSTYDAIKSMEDVPTSVARGPEQSMPPV
jgi:hypothetical protein